MSDINNKDLFDDNEEDFEKLLNQSADKSDSFYPGDRVKGTVISVAGDTVFVDISGKSEAMIDTSEFIDESGNINVKQGDSFDAFVVSFSKGEITLTRTIGRGSASNDLLSMAHLNSIPVHGTITEMTKGGYNVSVGGIKAFCPFSQFDLKASSDNAVYVGKSFDFIVTKTEGGKNIVLSRKILLQSERSAGEEKLKKDLKLGDIIKGRITSIRDFGFFADINGAEALIPKSEISWSRNTDPNILKEGDTVTAKVISLDWENKKITLSIKQALPDPWNNISKYPIGTSVNAKITNIINSGAFAEIEPGIEGFIHVSKMSKLKKTSRPEDAVKRGESVRIKILDVNEKDKKISLELLTGESDPWELPADELLGIVHTAVVESSSKAGITARLQNGMLGFIPRSELANSTGDPQRDYTAGKEIKAGVLEINQKDQRLILSELLASKNEENADYGKFIEKNTPTESSNLGSQFKNKFDDILKKVDNRK